MPRISWLITVLALALSLSIMLHQPPAVALSKDPILYAVLPFKVSDSRYAHLSSGAQSMLASRLAQPGSIEPIPPSLLKRALGDLPGNSNEARIVIQELGVAYLVTGSIDIQGGNAVVTVKVYGNNGLVWGRRAEGSDAMALLVPILERFSTAIRTEMASVQLAAALPDKPNDLAAERERLEQERAQLEADRQKLTQQQSHQGDKPSLQPKTGGPLDRRVALIIGNSTYREAPLKNPANDARDMAAALKAMGFEIILRENATRRAMQDAIDQFWTSLQKGGTGLFFFAGHGLQVGGENYLVPVDAQIKVERDVQDECVSAGRVLGRMENAGNGMNLVILDACRNNPFARSFRSGERGLAKMDAPSGSLVAFATAPGDIAADGTGKNGLYTSHLLRHLRTPGLSVENLLKRVRIGVAEESSKLGKKQTPWESSSLMGDFFFVP